VCNSHHYAITSHKLPACMALHNKHQAWNYSNNTYNNNKKLSCHKGTMWLLHGSVLAKCNWDWKRYFAVYLQPLCHHLACKAIEFGEITQNKGYYVVQGQVVQGHSRSPTYIPIESSYAMWAEVSFILSQSTCLTERRSDGLITVRCITCSRTVIIIIIIII